MTDLPQEWRGVPLAEVCQYVRGVTYGKSDASDKAKEGFLPLLRATNIADGRLSLTDFVYVPTEKVKPNQLLRGGDLVMAASSGSIHVVGKSAPAPEGFVGTFGAFCAVLRPNHETNHQYLNYFISSPKVREIWSAAARGTNINNLKREPVLGTAIPLPPLAEQQRIVEILEEQFSRLDAALASIRTVRDKAVAFRRSLLQAAFSGTFSEQPIGEWRVEALSNIAELSLGVMLDRAKDTGESQVRYLANINVRWGSFETGHLKTMQVLPKQIDRATIRCGDLVVCEGGEPGRCAIWGGESGIAIQKALHRVRPTADVISSYLYHYFEFRFRGVQSDELFTGTTIRHLPKEKLATLKIPLPSLAEQQRVVDILQEQLSRFDAAINIANQLEARINFEGRSLLHSAFEGTLTAQWRETHHG